MSKTLELAAEHLKFINPDTSFEKGFNIGVNSVIGIIQSLPTESKEITMSEILDIPRQIAVAFADQYIDMRDTVKLASDIQNFAIQYAESKDQWISVTNGWPKINGWYLTKRQSENGTIKYSADWFLTEHPGDCEMEETGWHNIVEYKLIEAYLPSPPTK